jgi:DNA-binding response OmpR family regulator
MYTVLIVDDSTITLRTVSAQLRRHGFTVVSTEMAGGARKQLAARPIDVVILDLGIPDADGITLLRELRCSKSYHSLPIIVLTGSGHDRDRIDARAAGATAFLTKPVSTTELVQTVNRALAISGHPQPMSSPRYAAHAHLR